MRLVSYIDGYAGIEWEGGVLNFHDVTKNNSNPSGFPAGIIELDSLIQH